MINNWKEDSFKF